MSSEAMWRVCEVEELLVVNVLFPVNSLCTSIMSPLTLLSSSEVIHIICEQADNCSYLGHSNIIESTRFVVPYHLSAAHHTSPVPEYLATVHSTKTVLY